MSINVLIIIIFNRLKGDVSDKMLIIYKFTIKGYVAFFGRLSIIVVALANF